MKVETQADLLQMAVIAVNNSNESEELCPTLFVFEASLRPARTVQAASQISRAMALGHAIEEVRIYHHRQKIYFGLNYNGPSGKERKDLDN